MKQGMDLSRDNTVQQEIIGGDDHIDGTYIGEVKKSGSQFFILENSKAEDIEWVRIIISSPMNEDFDRMGEGIDFKVEI